MNKQELIRKFREWRDDDENEKIVATILALPDSELDDDILSWLAEAYIDIDEYKQAIAVLESQRGRLEDDYRWHFRMGLALLRAAEDEECEDDDDLKENILDRAKVALARGMNMNPPESVLESADRYMEQIEDMLDELHGVDSDGDADDEDSDLDFYEEEEMEAVEEHIKEYYGDFPTVFHEISSPDIHCDICIVPPSKEKNYYTLITMGMGAHIMDIPDDLDPSEDGRAELLICLPPDWKVGENSEEWFWPIALLKNLARLPINSDSWLGWGHSVDNQTVFAAGTQLCGSLLLYPENVADGAENCTLPNGDTVKFYEVLPLYREEMDFKIHNGTKALLEQMQDVSHILDITRPNCCEGYEVPPHQTIDCIKDHSDKIGEKDLPLDPICGANHIAIFLRWCIEHKLIAPEFYENCSDVVEGVLSGSQTDLREFIANYFAGELMPYQLSFLGAGFAHYYYNWDRSDAEFFYPSDVDKYAEDYFGTERYNSEEFKDEAYLFVPFDEKYYQGMSKYIERAFFDFYPSFADYQYRCSEKILEGVENKLGIKAAAVRHYDEVKKEFEEAREKYKGADIVPIIMIVDDGGAVTSSDDFEDLLLDSLNAFLETIAIARLPKEFLDGLGTERFASGKPKLMRDSKRIRELRESLRERFGTEPAMLTFDEERSVLYMSCKDGYIGFMGEGIEREEDDT